MGCTEYHMLSFIAVGPALALGLTMETEFGVISIIIETCSLRTLQQSHYWRTYYNKLYTATTRYDDCITAYK